VKRSRETPWFFVLAMLVALGLLYHALRQAQEEGRTRIQYEDLAVSRLAGVVSAEIAFHDREGRYGWLPELRAAGLLKGIRTERMQGDWAVPSPRYRIDLLLPTSMSPENKVRLALQSAGRHNANLEARHFAAVARPWSDARTGYRTFYRDESGETYVSEGVSDIPSRTSRPLPDLHLSYGSPPYSGQLRWYRIDRLPKR